MSRGNRRLPRHMPPINVPSKTPSETAEEPMTSWRSWNQTISYIKAAQPLPMNNRRTSGSQPSAELARGEEIWPDEFMGTADGAENADERLRVPKCASLK